MEDYVCITVLSNPGESRSEFAARLSRFWTGMLRDRVEEFEKIYAETTAFEEIAGRLSRQYLAESAVLGALEKALKSAGIDQRPIDPDELFTKYEAVSPEWMQIEHSPRVASGPAAS